MGAVFTNYLNHRPFTLLIDLQACIRQPQTVPQLHPHDLCRPQRLLPANLRRTVTAHLAGSQIHNPTLIPFGGMFNQCASKANLHIIGMGAKSQNIQFHRSPLPFKKNCQKLCSPKDKVGGDPAGAEIRTPTAPKKPGHTLKEKAKDKRPAPEVCRSV